MTVRIYEPYQYLLKFLVFFVILYALCVPVFSGGQSTLSEHKEHKKYIQISTNRNTHKKVIR